MSKESSMNHSGSGEKVPEKTIDQLKIFNKLLAKKTRQSRIVCEHISTFGMRIEEALAHKV